MTLSVALRQRLGTPPEAFDLDVSFEASGRLVALFGRSGAGKTSVVNAIAGLSTPQSGRIAVDGTVFLDTARGIDVKRHRRRVGYVFQEDRLFPHLSVRKNLLYGRWFAGMRASRPIGDVVDLLGIGHLLARRPAGLSGGEKQRVAIGRALLAEPRLLLMDEPLASLDDERKAEILPYLERLRDEASTPILYVSHSVAEVARLATTVVVLSQGRTAAVGPVGDILGGRLPAGEALAAETGGMIVARIAEHCEADGLTVLAAAAGRIAVGRVHAPVGRAIRMRIRARDVLLATERPVGLSALNVLPATVLAVDGRDTTAVDVTLDLAGDRLVARITRRSLSDLRIAPGQPIFAILKSVAVSDRDIGLSFTPRDEE